ncbi:hypothetical protein MVEN_02086500 [Mycena venus]|uniref:Uncharacterized protein n=1 Tax=Mycena venus TaxID=2733690 RepID=A0A8H6XDK7_9AGAR|nr:hypothetical protein MVEN_02086500 [Mycena venus]
MAPMSSSSSHNTGGRRRPVAANARRRPLVRSNSSLLGTIKNIVTAPLAWFATTEDFEESPDLKGKRRRNPAQNSNPAADHSEGPPQTKRARVKSPDNQIQFHPEPQYAAPAYSQPPMGYLDPPVSVFNNNNIFHRSNSVNMTAPTLNQFNPSNRSGLSRTMSIDPPHSSIPFSRDTTMNFAPLDRDASMEPSAFTRKSSSIPRDHSMPLPPARSSFRLRTSLTPQPVQPREVSEPPPLSSLAQKPVFVRPPPDSRERVSSQSSTSSTLGSLVDSQRSTRSPMRQHSSLLFGSGSQTQGGESHSARQPAPAERALHELDIYKTPLLPTRSRLRTSGSPPDPTKAVDPSDMFRPRRSSQLLLMRDDRRASLGRKSSYGFLDTEEPKDKEGKVKKPKVNETKPYAGEGGMKKLLARRMKEVQDDEDEDTEVSRAKEPAERLDESGPETSQPLPPLTSSSRAFELAKKAYCRNLRHPDPHYVPSRKFSAAFDDVDEFMDDGEDEERQKEREELEEAAKKLPAFDVPAGFTFAKEPNVKPPVDHDANAPEPPIAALPFSFGKPSVPSEPVVPLSVPKAAPAAIPQPTQSSIFASEIPAIAEKMVEPEKPSSTGGAVPNFFASSKLLAQAPPLPPAVPSFGISSSTPLATPSPDATPKPFASTMFPSTPAPASLASFTPTSTPIKDAENPFWEGDNEKKSKSDSSAVLTGGDSQPFSFGAPKASGDNQAASGKTDTAPTTSIFGGSIFSAAKKDESTTSSIFDTSKPPATSGFMFGASSGGGGASASTSSAPEPSATEAQPKPIMGFGSTAATTSAAVEAEVPKAPMFPFGQAASTSAADGAKPLSIFGTPASAPPANPFTSSAAPEAPKPAFGGFSFGQQKEPPKSTPATSSSFTFGPTPSASMASDPSKPATTPFSFGAPAATAPASSPAFSFGTGVATADSKPTTSGGGMFTFGTPAVMAPSARPSTPPRNDMQEFTMEESPTRDMQADTKPAAPRPQLGGAGSGFSFSNPSSSGSLFGQAPAAPASTPFTFGASPSPNPFAAPTAAETKPFSGSDFGRPATASNPFAFGQNNSSSSTIDPPRPSTAGSFSFPSGPSTGTGFSFGGGNTTNPTNPFAPQPSGGSAPSSPSTFNQPFSFGAPQQSTSFSFGTSQPASPAGAPPSLPQPTTPGGFGGGGFGAQQPSSPFGGSGAQPAGGSLFTIGAAPPPAPAAGNAPRVLKKLPRRKQG